MEAKYALSGRTKMVPTALIPHRMRTCIRQTLEPRLLHMMATCTTYALDGLETDRSSSTEAQISPGSDMLLGVKAVAGRVSRDVRPAKRSICSLFNDELYPNLGMQFFLLAFHGIITITNIYL